MRVLSASVRSSRTSRAVSWRRVTTQTNPASHARAVHPPSLYPRESPPTQAHTSCCWPSTPRRLHTPTASLHSARSTRGTRKWRLAVGVINAAVTNVRMSCARTQQVRRLLELASGCARCAVPPPDRPVTKILQDIRNILFSTVFGDIRIIAYRPELLL
jgi:hypothetical protein